MNLSKHFTLEELTVSEAAARRGIDNIPKDAETLKNLEKLAVKLEEIRTLLGDNVMIITSGYRCPDLNFILKAAVNSEHLTGLAADFICPAFGTPYDICKKIEGSSILFNQLIHEYGKWCHIGFNGTRKEVLTICAPKLGYKRGVFKCG